MERIGIADRNFSADLLWNVLKDSHCDSEHFEVSLFQGSEFERHSSIDANGFSFL